MEALPEIDESLKIVAADLELTTVRAEHGWEAFAKAAGSKFGDAGYLSAVRLRTDQEEAELVARRRADADDWKDSPSFQTELSQTLERAARSEEWASGRASAS